MEDYTGHSCVNCPRAAKAARNLEALYGEKLIVMSVHVGDFALPAPGDGLPEDFRTQAGTDWDNKFIHTATGTGLPNGMVNRWGFPTTSNIIGDGAWGSKISSMMTQVPYMSVAFQNNIYTAADSTVSGTVKVKVLKVNNYKTNLTICITEDSIIAGQKNSVSFGDPSLPAFVPNYNHMHLLRGSINGSWGSTVFDGTAYNLVGTEKPTSYTYKIPKSLWKVKNLHLIAFVYDANTYEVLQAEEIPVQ